MYILTLKFLNRICAPIMLQIIQVDGPLHLEIYIGLMCLKWACLGVKIVIISKSHNGSFPGSIRKISIMALRLKVVITTNHIIIMTSAILYCSGMEKCF